MRTWAWLTYVPVPGLAWLVAFAAPRDRALRYHAWQGGTLTLLLWSLLVVIGLIGRASEAAAFRSVIGVVSLLVILAALAGMVFGAVGAARGLFVRVRPVWDLLAAVGR